MRVFLVTALTAIACFMCSGTAGAESTYPEQQGHHGANTFSDYHNASGEGTFISPASTVQVSCKVYDPTIVSANPDGYWYRIASSPWNDQYYAVANTFMNGDPWGGPYTHNTDFSVPDCGTTSPTPTSPTTSTTAPAPTRPKSVILIQGPVAPSGYRYAITLQGFAPDAPVSVSCSDTVNPGGFYTFSITTDNDGNVSTSSYCYSDDGPDHWVDAEGVESNHVSWGGTPSPATPPATNVSPVKSTAGPTPITPQSSSSSTPAAPPVNSRSPASPPGAPNVQCEQFQGTFVPNSDHVDVTLLDHYLGGSGLPVVIDWAFFKSNAGFASTAKGLEVNGSTLYRPSPSTDMYYALGTFTVRRTSSQCFTAYDQYDFTPNVHNLKSLYDLPGWALQLAGAQDFVEHASGQL